MLKLESKWLYAEQLLKRYYGYDSFRSGQAQIIRSILQGRDTVGIMPTGGGKSVCYQIPALLSEQVTLVISPLISLMKDQVDTLLSLGISATYINSTLSLDVANTRMRQAEQGAYRLLYVSPERMETESFLVFLSRLHPAHVAIDEAHCLSQWGHDFRPSYRAIAPALQQLDQRPIISAFTATATPEVVLDIVRSLDLREPEVLVTGFDRGNLTFSVITGQDKKDFILQYLTGHADQAGIIYAATRKEVDGLYEYLKKKRYAVGRYHAGLSDAERADNQERFLYDQLRIMVATNAFGMGIDKSNIRFVIHNNMPKNIEAYYQEAGRAGRDGDPGECVLLFGAQDVQTQKFLIEQTVLEEDRKSHEYKKLQAMVDYCHTTNCLREYILRYFGEAGPARCDNCSNCNQEFDLQDITVLAQQIFSCVARVKERYGIKLIAGVLKGSKDKRILELGLNHLSTYGLMNARPEKEIVTLIQTLVADGYLKLSEGQYPVVQLRPEAVPVLKQQGQVIMKMPKKKVVEQVSSALFEQLRALRKELALRDGVPPYVIFADSTLRELAAVQPLGREAMLSVKGVGETKLQKYGEDFLEVIRAYVIADGDPDEIGLSSPARHEDQAKEAAGFASGKKQLKDREVTIKTPEKLPSHIISYQMYREGMSPEHIARDRNMSQVTVEDHLLRSAEEGQPFNWDEIIPGDQEELVLAAAKEYGVEKLRVLKDNLPPEVSYFVIRAVLGKHKFRRHTAADK